MEKTLVSIKLKLPSSFVKILPLSVFVTLGRNSCSNHFKQYFGKASSIYMNRSLQVRGVAKNPVDHPHGGRTRGKMTFLTP
jgi:large subunit ribosomal protein L2